MNMDDQQSPSTPENQSCVTSAAAIRCSLARLTIGEVGLTPWSTNRYTMRRKKLFEKEYQPLAPSIRMPSWSVDEEQSLVSFLMLYTAGDTWVAHKNMFFWLSAGKFIQQKTKTFHCRSGESQTLLCAIVYQMYCVAPSGKACRLRTTTVLKKRFKSPSEADAHFLQELSPPFSMDIEETAQVLVLSKHQQMKECLDFFAALEKEDQLSVFAEMLSRHFPSVPPDFFSLVINSTKHLKECNRTNVIYTLAKVVGTSRPDGKDSFLPVKKMPFGLLEYTINFFGATSTQKVLIVNNDFVPCVMVHTCVGELSS